MNAQQQLAELIRKFPRDDQWDVDACVFIHDHGSAIAELITRADRLADVVQQFTSERNYKISKSNENSAFVDYRDLADMRGHGLELTAALSRIKGE